MPAAARSSPKLRTFPWCPSWNTSFCLRKVQDEHLNKVLWSPCQGNLLSDEHICKIYEHFYKRNSSSYLRGEIYHRLDAERVCEWGTLKDYGNLQREYLWENVHKWMTLRWSDYLEGTHLAKQAVAPFKPKFSCDTMAFDHVIHLI